MDVREIIARRISQEFISGMVVNLGIGLPTASANYIPDGVDVILQTENGDLSLAQNRHVKTPTPTWQMPEQNPLPYYPAQAHLIFPFLFVLYGEAM